MFDYGGGSHVSISPTLGSFIKAVTSISHLADSDLYLSDIHNDQHHLLITLPYPDVESTTLILLIGTHSPLRGGTSR
jgi:hypothetical protein